jgi:hypothetical protein
MPDRATLGRACKSDRRKLGVRLLLGLAGAYRVPSERPSPGVRLNSLRCHSPTAVLFNGRITESRSPMTPAVIPSTAGPGARK